MQTIHLNATQARKRFFDIFDQSINQNINFVIHKRRQKKRIVIQPEKQKSEPDKQSPSIMHLQGTFPIQKQIKNETHLAHKIYALKKAQKYETRFS